MIENNNTVITTQRTIYDRAKDLLPEGIALLTGSVTAIGVGILIFGTPSAAPLIFGVLLSDTVAYDYPHYAASFHSTKATRTKPGHRKFSKTHWKSRLHV